MLSLFRYIKLSFIPRIAYVSPAVNRFHGNFSVWRLGQSICRKILGERWPLFGKCFARTVKMWIADVLDHDSFDKEDFLPFNLVDIVTVYAIMQTLAHDALFSKLMDCGIWKGLFSNAKQNRFLNRIEIH